MKEYIIYLLSRRDYSVYELNQKCRQKGYEQQEIDDNIAKVQELHYQSDERFCEYFILTKANAGFGIERIKAELRYKGIADAIIAEKLDECAINWHEIAKSVLNKKNFIAFNATATDDLQSKEHYFQQKQKIYRFMITRGFKPQHFMHLIDY